MYKYTSRLKIAVEKITDLFKTPYTKSKNGRAKTKNIINSYSFNTGYLLERINKLVKTEELFKCSALTITSLAKKVGTNRTYLSSCFKVHNTTYMEYISNLRLDYAKKIMDDITNINKTVIEISELSGFPNPRSFSKYFARKYNMTPSQYKKKIIASSFNKRNPKTTKR